MPESIETTILLNDLRCMTGERRAAYEALKSIIPAIYLGLLLDYDAAVNAESESRRRLYSAVRASGRSLRKARRLAYRAS